MAFFKREDIGYVGRDDGDGSAVNKGCSDLVDGAFLWRIGIGFGRSFCRGNWFDGNGGGIYGGGSNWCDGDGDSDGDRIGCGGDGDGGWDCGCECWF